MDKERKGKGIKTMQQFEFQKTEIEDALLVTPFFADDNRGYFAKNYERSIYMSAGINREIAEEFETYSKHNVIRGLHFQTNYPQDKIVRCVNGQIFDVIVDLRKNSRTFGQWRGFVLNECDHKSLLIPQGCAHGFLVQSQSALVSYICAGKYYIEYDAGIVWDDPTLNIAWPIDEQCDVVLSDKDNKLMTFEMFILEHGGF